MKTEITKPEKILSFEKAVEPLFKWMEENCCPHDIVVVDTMSAQLLNGQIGVPSPLNRKYRQEV